MIQMQQVLMAKDEDTGENTEQKPGDQNIVKHGIHPNIGRIGQQVFSNGFDP